MTQTVTLAECLYLLVGKSCWTKLFSRNQSDKKRLETIQNGIKAMEKQVQRIRAFAEKTSNTELQWILVERFDYEDTTEP